jgi:serine/threonine-protein kinase
LVNEVLLGGQTMSAAPSVAPGGGVRSAIAHDKTTASAPPLGPGIGSMTNPHSVVTPTHGGQAAAAFVTEPVFAELAAGQTVGEYVVERKLGEGGMAMVYAGVHPLIGKKVAIKVLAPALAAEPDIVRRFIQEARAVNQIGHRNIVDIFSFGRLPDARHYFVMELLEGQPLTRRLADRRRPLEWRESVEIWLQVTSAIAAAHARGIVHRDLKPDNLFLVASGDGVFMKVLDFGIAKLTGEGPDVRRTATGIPMGTPIYMSPEQTAGRGVDHRTDLYAFGIMMYEMVCGRPPFDSDNYVEILHAHLSKPPPPLAQAARVDSRLEALIMRMIAKKPDDRPPTMEAVREALVGLREAVQQSGQPLFVRPEIPADRAGAGTPSAPPPSQETELVEPRPPPVRMAPRGLPVYLSAIVVLSLVTGGIYVYGRYGRGGSATAQPPAPVAPAPVAPTPVAPVPTPAAAERPPTGEFGRIKLTVVPKDVEEMKISLNGQSVFPAQLASMKAGPYHLAVEAPGYKPFNYDFRIEAGDDLPVEVKLVKLDATPPPRPGHGKKKGTQPARAEESPGPPPPPQPLDRNGTIKPSFGDK